MKRILKLLAVLTAMVAVLSLGACGGSDSDSDSDDVKSNKASTAASTDSKDNSVITAPDFNAPSGDEKGVYEIIDDEINCTDTFEIYYSENKIKSVTNTMVMDLGGIDEEYCNAVKEATDSVFEDYAKGKNVSCSSIVGKGALKFVMAVLDLDEQENLKAFEEAEVINGFTADMTFSDLEEMLKRNGYEKK